MSRIALAPIVLIVLLAACQPPPDPGHPGGGDLRRCSGTAVGALMGQPISALPASGGWTALRVIKPGMAVTEDYAPTRLNIALNGQGRIIGVACG